MKLCGFRKRLFILCFLIGTLLANGFVHAKIKDIQTIMKRIEQNFRGKSSSTGEFEMKIVKKEWTRTLRLKFWDKVPDKMLVTILYPPKEKHVSTLKIKNQIWNYIPRIGRVMKIPPSMLSQSWMGSHFTNEDLIRETSWTTDYIISIEQEEGDRLVLKLVPKPDVPVVWGYILMEVSRKDYAPRRMTYFDEHGEKVRWVEYTDIRNVDGHAYPFVWTLYPADKQGEYTRITILMIRFEENLDDSMFTLRYLRSLR